MRQSRTRHTQWWRVYLKQITIREVVTYLVFPEFMLLEISPESWCITNLPDHWAPGVCETIRTLRMCFLDFLIYWFPSSSWSCQCPCGCGTVVKRYIIDCFLYRICGRLLLLTRDNFYNDWSHWFQASEEAGTAAALTESLKTYNAQCFLFSRIIG